MRSLPIRRTTQSGFTLIELMIVVAVVGILSAVALPSYGEYTVRSRVAELAIMGASMKATVSENILNNGGTNLPGKDNCVGTTTSAQGTRNTRSVDCNPATGVITVTGTDAAANVVLTFAPRLTDAGAVSWQCLSAVEKFSVVPAECRVAS